MKAQICRKQKRSKCNEMMRRREREEKRKEGERMRKKMISVSKRDVLMGSLTSSS